ncbi:aryl-alcohol dehydrogenase [Bisporella sp. PMI_857]|nr:aryl-alcohol dehydrogenase [Bisporella sp. PMI_857]
MRSTYDFIIIGGGTAGLVVANRLSEDPSQRILVLEAGSDQSNDPRVKIPAFYEALKGSEADWAFQSEPQLNLKGRVISLHQGKALGGSSATNAHVFVPPAKSLIDAWETLGNKGWNWDVLKDYYAKAYTSPLVHPAQEHTLGIDNWTARNDGAKGPIQTSFPGDSSHPIRKAWAETLKTSGYHMTQDPFLNASIGGFSALASIDPVTKERSYAVTAYYNPIKSRGNLHVITNALVEKILFEEVGGVLQTTGVQYRYHNETKTVAASKEVILSAGALQSPKILELSGVGDASLLQKHGIKAVMDLRAVGENLQDHIVCGIAFEAVDDIDTLDALVRQEPEALRQAMQDYVTKQTGLLTSVGVTTYAYLPVIEHLSEKGREDLESLLDQYRPSAGDNLPGDKARTLAYYNLVEQTLLNPQQPSGAFLTVLAQNTLPINPGSDSSTGLLPGKFLTLGTMLSNPLSRGSVHIASGDVLKPPTIDPNYFAHPLDIEVLGRHMLHLETLASPPFPSSPGGLHLLLKQPLVHRDPASRLATLKAAEGYLRTNAISMWHIAGTCAMLPREMGGVVDATLKVYGVNRLRVVDASAVPLVSTANLQATIYGLAERAADIVKEEWGLK